MLGYKEPEPAAPQSYSLVPPAGAGDWDAVLRSNDASLLQSWQWGEFKRGAGWSPLRAVLRETRPANGQGARPVVAAQVLFKSVPRMPLPVSAAYIPRGPVFIAGDGAAGEMQALWAGIHRAAKRRGAIFLKVEPNIELGEQVCKADVDRSMAALGFRHAGRLQPARTIVLDLSKDDTALLGAMKSKTRYNLRLAERRGVQVRRAETYDDLRAFYNLLETTGERDEFGIHTFPYYERMWQMFGPGGNNSALLLLAEHPDAQEQAAGPIAGLLALRFGREAVYMYGASANRGREHMPTYLIQWRAIQWAREVGCTVYDFWGIPDAPSEDDAGTGGAGEASLPVNARSGLRGVYWFKKGFGGREVEYPGAYDYVYNPLAYRVWLRLRGADLG